MKSAQAPRLPLYLALVCAGLIALVCLNPLTGWRDMGVGAFSFLSAPLPRDRSRLDLALNLLGFLPLGFLTAAALRYRFGAIRLVLLTTLGCLLLSLSVEVLQNYLPGRVASNIDLLTNTVGGLAGALCGLRWGGIFDQHGALSRWRRRRVLSGHIGELGLVLVCLWWLGQLQPSAMLFAAGDLRPLLDLASPIVFSARRYMILETAVVASQLLAVALVCRRIMRAPSVLLLLLILVLGVAVRSLSGAVFVEPSTPGLWMTTGALRGCLLGSVLVLAAWRLPGWLQHVVASVALLFTTALVNMAPENPFLELSVHMISSSHAINFTGLTQLVASLWPMLALVYLTLRMALVRDDAFGLSR